MTDRLTALIATIDDANARDPSFVQTDDGPQPAALIYGRRLSGVLSRFAPGASEQLEIAARGQHIERWLRPRLDYPEGRDGYLRWRRDAAQYHASRITELMLQGGYDPEACARVSSLLLKKNLKTDNEVQTLEDVACLAFFRWYAGDFSREHDAVKVLSIVTKTARKMSAAGRAAAAALDLPPAVLAAIAAVE